MNEQPQSVITEEEQRENTLPDLESGGQKSALLSLLNRSGARRILAETVEDLGLAESRPFPFLAMIGQYEMRTALLLSVINPSVGGVLLIGPRGVGKTTAVRSLIHLLPDVERSYEKEGELVTYRDSVKLVELPLNARLEDVVGGVNERIAIQQNRVQLERGILARADQNLLYVDEINLLDDVIVDAILDAAAQGAYTVRRGAMVGTYRARFVLIGSMNPEEGELRPQIMDRFGLRVVVKGLENPEQRLEVYRRVRQYQLNPQAFVEAWANDTAYARQDIINAQEILKETTLNDEAVEAGLNLIESLRLDSYRAEHTLFEAARAHAAADSRTSATVEDIRQVATMALRQRRSEFMAQFIEQQAREDQIILEKMPEAPTAQEEDVS